MATFTVHVPPGIADGAGRADRTIFVRDGFSLAAFVFGPLYLVYRRLWRATLAWIVAAAMLALLARAVDLPPPSSVLLGLVLAVLTGLEAREARRQALGRRGYIASAVLTGVTRETGERMFFGRDAALVIPESPDASSPRRRPVPSSGGQPAVIGLFPLPGDGLPDRRA